MCYIPTPIESAVLGYSLRWLKKAPKDELWLLQQRIINETPNQEDRKLIKEALLKVAEGL